MEKEITKKEALERLSDTEDQITRLKIKFHKNEMSHQEFTHDMNNLRMIRNYYRELSTQNPKDFPIA